MLISLINNIAFLIALGAAGQIIYKALPQRKFTREVILGLVFGVVALLGMLNPVHFLPGIIFDGRTIVLAVAGVVGGAVTATIAAAIAAIYRIQLGGSGAVVGVFVAVSAALLGVIARSWWQRRKIVPQAVHYLLLGVIVQFMQLGAFTQIPDGAGYPFIQQAWWVLLLFYPLATMMLCMIFRDQEKSGRDQQALKAAQETISKERAMLDTLVNTLPDLIWLKDTNGVYLKCNQRFEEFFGAEAKDIVGKTDYDYVSRELADFFRENDNFAILKNQVCSNEEKIVFASDGHREILNTTKVPMHDEKGNIIGILGVAHDITLLKQQKEQLDKYNQELRQQVGERTRELKKAKEAAEKANEEKSRFLANMSHELRTPMHAIHSFTKLAMKRDIDEKARHFLENILVSTQRLTDLLNNLLDLSKLEAGKMELHVRMHTSKDLVLEVAGAFSGLLKEAHLKLDVDGVADIEASFDAKLITQVITNLLSNAIRFSPAGGTVKLATTVSQNAFQLSVEDEGIGVPGSEQRNIFDSFIQSSKTMSDSGGTGLGLAISKEIIELHGGSIWVESPPKGKTCGSIFSFSIPVSISQ